MERRHRSLPDERFRFGRQGHEVEVQRHLCLIRRVRPKAVCLAFVGVRFRLRGSKDLSQRWFQVLLELPTPLIALSRLRPSLTGLLSPLRHELVGVLTYGIHAASSHIHTGVVASAHGLQSCTRAKQLLATHIAATLMVHHGHLRWLHLMWVRRLAGVAWHG
jgi:hypothetical protein